MQHAYFKPVNSAVDAKLKENVTRHHVGRLMIDSRSFVMAAVVSDCVINVNVNQSDNFYK